MVKEGEDYMYENEIPGIFLDFGDYFYSAWFGILYHNYICKKRIFKKNCKKEFF